MPPPADKKIIDAAARRVYNMAKQKTGGACVDRLRGRIHLRPLNLMRIMPP